MIEIPNGWEELKTGDIIKSSDLFHNRIYFLTQKQIEKEHWITYIGKPYRRNSTGHFAITIRRKNTIKVTPAQEKIIIDFLNTNRATNADRAMKLSSKQDDIQEQIAQAMVEKNTIKSIDYGSGNRYYI